MFTSYLLYESVQKNNNNQIIAGPFVEGVLQFYPASYQKNYMDFFVILQ